MKKLCLIRHAKSNWGFSAPDDFNRPLEPHGEEDAATVGRLIKDKGLKPAIILSSPAKRAIDTAQIIACELDYPRDRIVTDQTFYNGGVEELLVRIQTLDDAIDEAILIGHNPGLTWFTNYLADIHITTLHTSGVYCIEFETEKWSEITLVEGKVCFSENPQHFHHSSSD